jgi:hypothetical protein
MSDDHSTSDEVLIDAPLVEDPDVKREMGGGIAAIADEDFKGCRLLVVRRDVQAIKVDGAPGGLVKIGISFQPTHGTRFVWAQMLLTLKDPEDSLFVDVAPATKMDRPVKFTVDVSGKLGASYQAIGELKAGLSTKTSTEFEVYHCAVHGTGAGTAKGRWEFEENPQGKQGLGREQTLFMTVRGSGKITGNLSVYTRLVREGAVLAKVDAAAHLIMGPDQRHAPLTLRIP